MATNNSRTMEQVRLEIEAEREQLADAVDNLRSEIEDVTDVRAKLRAHLPVVAATALGAGFLFAGGIGPRPPLVEIGADTTEDPLGCP